LKSKGEILHEADYHEQGHYELNTVKNLHGGHNIDNRRPQEERWVRTRPASGRHRIKRPWIPQWVVNFLFPMSLLWQLLTILILYLTMNHSDDRIVKIGEIVITAFQVAHPIPHNIPQQGSPVPQQGAHAVMMMFASVKLATKLLHRTADGWFLISAYLSTVLLFAGIYSLLYADWRILFEGGARLGN